MYPSTLINSQNCNQKHPILSHFIYKIVIFILCLQKVYSCKGYPLTSQTSSNNDPNQYEIIRRLMNIDTIESNEQKLTLTLESNGRHKKISQILKYSCWHPVMVVEGDEMGITVQVCEGDECNQGYNYDLDRQRQEQNNQEEGLVRINMEVMNWTHESKVPDFSNFKLSLKVLTSSYPTDQQTTEVINIIILPSNKTFTRKVYILTSSSSPPTFIIPLPTIPLILTQTLALILTILLPYNIQYRRIKPLTFNIPFSILYSGLLFVGVYLNVFFNKDQDYQWELGWQQAIVGIFSGICMFLYSRDLLIMLVGKWTGGKKLSILIDTISGLLAIGIVLLDLTILRDAWFVNNIIAIMAAGCLIKFAIIRKLKSSLIPLLILWAFFICRQFAIDFHLQTYQQSLQLQLIPLFLQMPSQLFSSPSSGLLCSSFSTSKIIAYGLLLHYTIRVDLSFSHRFYQKMSIFLIVICMSIQLCINLLWDQLPMMEFIGGIAFMPAMIISMVFFAKKRGEWSEVWHGGFYDLAVQRVQIKRDSAHDVIGIGNQGSVVEDIQQGFGEGLRINNATLLSGK